MENLGKVKDVVQSKDKASLSVGVNLGKVKDVTQATDRAKVEVKHG